MGNCSEGEEGNMSDETLLWKTLGSIVLTERGRNSLFETLDSRRVQLLVYHPVFALYNYNSKGA